MLYEVITEYLEFVHDVPIPEIVPPRPELGEMLSSLPGRRVVFTNGSESYARRVLLARITSYNVCYTKLLRSISSRF